MVSSMGSLKFKFVEEYLCKNRQCSIERKLLSAEQEILVNFSKENTLNSAKFFRVRVRVRVRVIG